MQQLSAANEMSKAIPIRMVCIHLCVPNIDVYRIMKKVVSMENTVWNSRTKIHIGNSDEWQYALQKHGIPTNSIPLTETGKINQGQYGGYPDRDCTSVTYLEELRREISILTQSAYTNFDNDVHHAMIEFSCQ